MAYLWQNKSLQVFQVALETARGELYCRVMRELREFAIQTSNRIFQGRSFFSSYEVGTVKATRGKKVIKNNKTELDSPPLRG